MFIPEVATLPMASKPAMVDTAKGTSVDSENGEIVSPPPPNTQYAEVAAADVRRFGKTFRQNEFRFVTKFLTRYAENFVL